MIVRNLSVTIRFYLKKMKETYFGLFDLHCDDLFPLADDLHQLITLLHQLGFMHGCVYLQKKQKQTVKNTYTTTAKIKRKEFPCSCSFALFCFIENDSMFVFEPPHEEAFLRFAETFFPPILLCEPHTKNMPSATRLGHL